MGLDKYQDALYIVALKHYIDIVIDRFGGQVSIEYTISEAKKMLDRETEEFINKGG